MLSFLKKTLMVTHQAASPILTPDSPLPGPSAVNDDNPDNPSVCFPQSDFKRKAIVYFKDFLNN